MDSHFLQVRKPADNPDHRETDQCSITVYCCPQTPVTLRLDERTNVSYPIAKFNRQVGLRKHRRRSLLDARNIPNVGLLRDLDGVILNHSSCAAMNPFAFISLSCNPPSKASARIAPIMAYAMSDCVSHT